MKRLCVDHMPVGHAEGSGLVLSTKAQCNECQQLPTIEQVKDAARLARKVRGYR
jgi:hypothetical protein